MFVGPDQRILEASLRLSGIIGLSGSEMERLLEIAIPRVVPSQGSRVSVVPETDSSGNTNYFLASITLIVNSENQRKAERTLSDPAALELILSQLQVWIILCEQL